MYEELKKWSETHNAIDRSIETLWSWFETYKTDDYDEFITVFSKDKENVHLYLDKISYELSLPDYEQETICVTIDIFVDEKQVGWFKQIYLMDGTMLDDFMAIY